MLNRNNDWEIIEAAYQNLANAAGFATDRPADPYTLKDYDLADAVDETAYQITGEQFPEIALLEAFARNGYLDNDEIWEEIGRAIGRGLEEYAAQEYQDWQDSLENPEDFGLE